MRRSASAAPFVCAALCALASAAAEPPRRIVSLNPSLTATLLALDAGPLLVGVDAWSAKQQPRVAELPTVGGLFDPSLEAVVALEPDLVVLVPSAEQRDLRDRLRGLGIAVAELPNITLAELLDSIEVLGRRVGRAEAASARVAEIHAAIARAEAAAAGRARPRTVLVLQRDPLFVVGAGSFLDALLRAAGAENAGARFEEPYPRVSLEWLIAEGPELILDATESPQLASDYWKRWPSIPAVATGRVVPVPADAVMLPGPHVDRGLAILAEILRDQADR